MNAMFYDCKSLTKINASNFSFENVMIMSDIISGCKSLSNIDISNFNLQNVEFKNSMFDGCICLPENSRKKFE